MKDVTSLDNIVQSSNFNLSSSTPSTRFLWYDAYRSLKKSKVAFEFKLNYTQSIRNRRRLNQRKALKNLSSWRRLVSRDGSLLFQSRRLFCKESWYPSPSSTLLVNGWKFSSSGPNIISGAENGDSASYMMSPTTGNSYQTASYGESVNQLLGKRKELKGYYDNNNGKQVLHLTNSRQ